MADKYLEEELYTAQHFGLTATGFVTYLCRSLQICLNQGLEDLEQKLLNEVTEQKEEIQEKLEHVRNKVFEYFNKRINCYFDLLERYIKDVLTVPDNVVLPQDQVQISVDCSKDKEEEADEKIKQKRNRLQAIYSTKSKLIDEVKEIDHSQAYVERLIEELQSLHTEETQSQRSRTLLNLEHVFEEVQVLQKSVMGLRQMNMALRPKIEL